VWKAIGTAEEEERRVIGTNSMTGSHTDDSIRAPAGAGCETGLVSMVLVAKEVRGQLSSYCWKGVGCESGKKGETVDIV
jgi:hypothetical protein